MAVNFIIIIFIFFFYYLSCFNSLKIDYKIIFIGLFLIVSTLFRTVVSPELNKDYFGYFDLHNFEDPEDIFSFLFSEPYLYLIYKFFNFIISDKKTIFTAIYWFNFSVNNVFFIWLATRLDLAIWKKMLLFVFYYFLFGFVLLRNGPVYILFACFFYYSYRNKRFNKVWITPFMHLSAISLVVTFFHKNKYYLRIFFLLLIIIIPIFLLYILPLLNDLIAFQNSMHKVDSYSEGMQVVSVFHKLYFVFISAILVLTTFIYRKQVFHPILVTTSVLYYISFFVNPVLGFRFSPYVLMAVLFFNSSNKQISKWNKYLNLISLLMLPYFIFTFLDTHSL